MQAVSYVAALRDCTRNGTTGKHGDHQLYLGVTMYV